jgi:hypothetical protein
MGSFLESAYLQSVLIHSANVARSCTKACRAVLTSTFLYLIGFRVLLWFRECDLKLYLQLQHLHIESGRQIYWCLRGCLVSGGSLRFKISLFGCILRHRVITVQEKSTEFLLLNVDSILFLWPCILYLLLSNAVFYCFIA